MKAKDVAIGELYAVKVSGKIACVVIDEEHPNGGWTGTNQETNRQVRLKTARRLRMPWDDYLKGGDSDDEPQADTAPEGAEESEGEPEAEEPEKCATRAKTGDDGATDAVATVLEEADQPLRCKEIAKRALRAGYRASDGKTPHATIYSAILRDMQNKGDESRFQKVGRGLFALAD